MHEAQRQRTQSLLQARNIDAALFASPASVTWLTGCAPPARRGRIPLPAHRRWCGGTAHALR